MNGRWINRKDDDKYHILTKINKFSLLYTDKLPFWSLLHKARGKSLPTTSCTCASWRCCIIFQRMIWTISTCSLKAWGLVKSYESWCVCVLTCEHGRTMKDICILVHQEERTFTPESHNVWTSQLEQSGLNPCAVHLWCFRIPEVMAFRHGKCSPRSTEP